MSRQGVAFVLTEYPCKTRLDTGLIGTEKILVKKISFWSKKFWSENNFWSENFHSPQKKLWSKKNIYPTNSWSEKNCGPK